LSASVLGAVDGTLMSIMSPRNREDLGEEGLPCQSYLVRQRYEDMQN